MLPLASPAYLVTAMVALTLVLGWIDSWLGAPTVALAIAIGVAVGWVAGPQRQAHLLLALVPATILTTSALIPHSGRYLPALTTTAAFLAAGRFQVEGFRTGLARLPRFFAVILIAYLGWMAVTTATSMERAVSASYLVGSVVMFVAIFVLAPRLTLSQRVLHQMAASLGIVALAIVLSGLVLLLLGSVHLYERSVGLYFFEELTLLGHRTGIVFPQDYGPFVSPNTAPDAFGLVAILYLRSVTSGVKRLLWTGGAIILLAGLVTTFSREGWLIAAIGCLALFVGALRGGAFNLAPLAVAALLVVLFVGGITSNISVLGRMDLVRAWYGPDAPAILLNPNLLERGQTITSPAGDSAPSAVPASPTPATVPASPTPAIVSASPAPAAVPTDTVELKGYSSLAARIVLWRAGLAAAQARPLFGYGAGTDADAILPYLSPENAYLRGATTHSTIVRVLVEMGVPGLLTYLAFVLWAAWYALRRLWAGQYSPLLVLAATVLGLLVSQFTGTLLLGGFSFEGFWLALAVGALAVAGPPHFELTP